MSLTTFLIYKSIQYVLTIKPNLTFFPAMHLLLLLVLVSISQGFPQKPNLDAILNRRTDVYIAGFFPFGKGVENSNTGTYFIFNHSLGTNFFGKGENREKTWTC